MQTSAAFDCRRCLCDLWAPFAEVGVDPYTIDWTPAEIPAPAAPVALPSRAQTIARLRADGMTWRAIGAHYGVSHTTARRWSLQAA